LTTNKPPLILYYISKIKLAMATFNTFSLLPIVLTCFAMLVETGISSPDAPTQPSLFEKHLNNCATKVYQPCGDEIFFSIVFGNQTVGKECCLNLVNEVGKQCHDDMTKAILTTEDFRKSKTSSILKRSAKVWDSCVSSLLNNNPQAAGPNVFNFNSIDPNVFNFY